MFVYLLFPNGLAKNSGNSGDRWCSCAQNVLIGAPLVFPWVEGGGGSLPPKFLTPGLRADIRCQAANGELGLDPAIVASVANDRLWPVSAVCCLDNLMAEIGSLAEVRSGLSRGRYRTGIRPLSYACVS